MDKKLIGSLPTGTKEFELVRPVHTLGRDPSCDIPVDHPSLSRQHAKFLVTEGSCVVTDLGSRNGTFVNNERVHGEQTLTDGDEVRCGNISFKYTDGLAGQEGEGFGKKRDGIVGVLSSDMELAEKFRKSSKMLNYGVFLPTLNWKLRMYLFVAIMVGLAAMGLLMAARMQQNLSEQKYARTLVQTLALENRVVFEQGLPFYSTMAVADEVQAGTVPQAYLLDDQGWKVFPPGARQQIQGFGNKPLSGIAELTEFPDPNNGTTLMIQPIYSGGRPRGYAVMQWDPKKLKRSSFTELSIIFGSIFVAVFGFVAMAVSTRIISKPIRNFQEEVELMVSGQLSQMSTYGGFPELNELVKTVYLLVMRLRARQS